MSQQLCRAVPSLHVLRVAEQRRCKHLCPSFSAAWLSQSQASASVKLNCVTDFQLSLTFRALTDLIFSQAPALGRPFSDAYLFVNL